MLRLQQDESYLWLFLVYCALFALCAMGSFYNASSSVFTLPVLIAPVLIAYVLACEIWSGVALNSMWRAEYLRGSWQYRASLAWHTTGVVMLSVFAFYFIP